MINPGLYIHRYPIIFLMLFTLLGVMLWFGPAFFNPNEYLFSGAGDGLRAYYATEYFLTWGDGVYQKNLLYPHGIHQLYVDMNPLLSNLMKSIQSFADIQPYTKGIMNTLMMLAFFPTAIFTYLLLRKTHIPVKTAIVFALLITFMSPQIRRVTGHYPLSYSFFIPVIWLILLKIQENLHTLKWMVIFSLITIIFTFMHPYYFLIAGAFLVSFLFVHLLQNWSEKKQYLSLYLQGIFFALLPGILIKIWEVATTRGPADYVAQPYGFLNYMAGFESVFLPSLEPFSSVWNYILPVRKLDMEGYAYVGLPGLVLLFFLVGRIIYLWRKKYSSRILKPVLPFPLQTTAWAAALLLIPAFAYPFQLFPSLLDYIPVAQFRSMGRLAWVFYFVFMVLCSWYVYAGYRALTIRGKSWAGRMVILIVCFSWGLAAWSLAKAERKSILNNHESVFPERHTDFSDLLETEGFTSEDFQAIIALPFFHIGSEKLQANHWFSNRYAFAVSQNTGLSMVNFSAARAPLSAALQAVNLVSHPWIEKPFFESIPDRRPLLLVYSGEGLSIGEKHLLDHAELILKKDGIQLFSLPLTAFDFDTKPVMNEWKIQKDSLHHHNGLFLSAPTEAVYWQPEVRELEASAKFATLYEGNLSVQWDQVSMEASVWIKSDIESNYLSHINVKQYKDGNLIDWQKKIIVETKDVDKDWIRAKIPFVLHGPGTKLVLDTRSRHLEIKSLLIRPENIDVVKFPERDSCMMINNYFICP